MDFKFYDRNRTFIGKPPSCGDLYIRPGARTPIVPSRKGCWVGKMYYAKGEDGRVICYAGSKWYQSYEVFT